MHSPHHHTYVARRHLPLLPLIVLLLPHFTFPTDCSFPAYTYTPLTHSQSLQTAHYAKTGSSRCRCCPNHRSPTATTIFPAHTATKDRLEVGWDQSVPVDVLRRLRICRLGHRSGSSLPYFASSHLTAVRSMPHKGATCFRTIITVSRESSADLDVTPAEPRSGS